MTCSTHLDKLNRVSNPCACTNHVTHLFGWFYLNQMHNSVPISLYGVSNAILHAKWCKCAQSRSKKPLIDRIMSFSPFFLPFRSNFHVRTLHANTPFDQSHAQNRFHIDFSLSWSQIQIHIQGTTWIPIFVSYRISRAHIHTKIGPKILKIRYNARYMPRNIFIFIKSSNWTLHMLRITFQQKFNFWFFFSKVTIPVAISILH